jgi:uncharacterized membrane protein
MKKRLLHYLDFYKNLSEQDMTPEEREQNCRKMLVQIQFFQHERLIHLIVTVLFALMTVMTLFASLLITQPILLVLELLFLVLLIPYIKHYYLLENGTQKLYEYYDAIAGETKVGE